MCIARCALAFILRCPFLLPSHRMFCFLFSRCLALLPSCPRPIACFMRFIHGMHDRSLVSGWLCLVLVRNPVDRALSSFFHVAATLLCDRWPELHAVVGDAAKVRAANYTFRQHVQALSLMPQHGSGTQPFSKGGWGVGHVLPQYSACLKPFFGGADQGKKIYTSEPPYKLLTIDDLPRSLAAADAAFRGSRLGIGQLAVGLHSAHWRSDPGAVAAFARAHRTSFEVAGPGVNRAAMLAAIRAHNAAGVDAHADVFASALCGHPGGLPVPRKLSEQSRGSTQICLPAPGTYRAMQATNRALWARVRCLFADDFALYHRSVCEQPWLRTFCEGCVARACGPAGLPLLY